MKKQLLTFVVEMPEDVCALELMQDMIEGYRSIATKTRGVKFRALNWYPAEMEERLNVPAEGS